MFICHLLQFCFRYVSTASLTKWKCQRLQWQLAKIKYFSLFQLTFIYLMLQFFMVTVNYYNPATNWSKVTYKVYIIVNLVTAFELHFLNSPVNHQTNVLNLLALFSMSTVLRSLNVMPSLCIVRTHLPHSVSVLGYSSSLPTCLISSVQVSVRQWVLPVQYSADQLPSAEKTHTHTQWWDRTNSSWQAQKSEGARGQDAFLSF